MRVSYVLNGVLCDVNDPNARSFFLSNEDSFQLNGKKQLFESPCIITSHISLIHR